VDKDRDIKIEAQAEEAMRQTLNELLEAERRRETEVII
jgi:hypothetical protein